MSDPLSIPDDKRAGNGLFGPPEHSWTFWIVVVAGVTVNGWFDYYHPRGILFDIIIGIIWAVKSDSPSRNK
jgi:hypothetical protein